MEDSYKDYLKKEEERRLDYKNEMDSISRGQMIMFAVGMLFGMVVMYGIG